MNRKTILPILLIILLSLVSYFNIFDNEFVWDDHIFILENSDIRSFSNLPLFFKEDMDGLYRPLRTAYYTFIYSIAGKNELIYHVNGIFLHIIISILIYFVIFEIVQKRNISLVAALIFSAHPIHTGRVTNITASFDMIGILFMLLSFYLYVKYAKTEKRKFFLLSSLSFLIAVFSSEEAITLPLLVILYEFTFNRERFTKKTSKNNILKNYVPLFAIALFYLIIRFNVLGFSGRQETYLAGTFVLTMFTMLKVYINYIWILIYPINLTLFHDIKPATSFFNFEVLISLLFLMGIFFLTIRYRKHKLLFFSVFWFFITLIPASNILPLQVFMAERYLYIPSIAFALLISYSLFNLKLNFVKTTLLKKIIIIFIVLLLFFYVAKTLDRNDDWQNNLTLWKKTVLTNPENSRAHDNLGFTYDHRGMEEKALAEFETAVALQKDNFRALANLGVSYAKAGRYNESLEVLQKSLQFREYHKTYDKLGLIYVRLGDLDKAIESFRSAIRINSRYAKAYNDLGTVYGRLGKFDLAMQSFNEAIMIDPDYDGAHYNKGILLDYLGDKDLAAKEFEIALSLEPENEIYKKKLRRMP